MTVKWQIGIVIALIAAVALCIYLGVSRAEVTAEAESLRRTLEETDELRATLLTQNEKIGTLQASLTSSKEMERKFKEALKSKKGLQKFVKEYGLTADWMGEVSFSYNSPRRSPENAVETPIVGPETLSLSLDDGRLKMAIENVLAFPGLLPYSLADRGSSDGRGSPGVSYTLTQHFKVEAGVLRVEGQDTIKPSYMFLTEVDSEGNEIGSAVVENSNVDYIETTLPREGKWYDPIHLGFQGRAGVNPYAEAGMYFEWRPQHGSRDKYRIWIDGGVLIDDSEVGSFLEIGKGTNIGWGAHLGAAVPIR